MGGGGRGVGTAVCECAHGGMCEEKQLVITKKTLERYKDRSFNSFVEESLRGEL